MGTGRASGDGRRVPSPVILPDGHVELVVNLGDPVYLTGPPYAGYRPDRVVVGPPLSSRSHAVQRLGAHVRRPVSSNARFGVFWG